MGAGQTIEVPEGDPRRIAFAADGGENTPRSDSQSGSAKSTPTKSAFPDLNGREIPLKKGPAPRQPGDSDSLEADSEVEVKRSMATAFGAPSVGGQNRRTVSSGGAFQFAWEELASSQKKLAAERKKLAEGGKQLELERQAIAEERKQLDEDRASLEAERRAFLQASRDAPRRPNLQGCDSGKLHQVSENLLDLSPQPNGVYDMDHLPNCFDSPETKGPSRGISGNPPRPCVGDMGLIRDSHPDLHMIDEARQAGGSTVRNICFQKETSSGASESTRSPRSQRDTHSRGVSYDDEWTAETNPEATLSKENLEKLWL